MIVLDTNVVSELMKQTPAAAVIRWVGTQPAASLFTTTVTQAEIFHGIMLLPKGRRRTSLVDAATEMFEQDFAGRTLPFGSDSARMYALIASDRRRLGRPISQFDAQVAAITRSSGAALATRNVSDFENCGVTVIDPWLSA
ncbi:MAG: type II toxin-antitoxin system VapC family toxin [Deltaproteobacteria bacterium]